MVVDFASEGRRPRTHNRSQGDIEVVREAGNGRSAVRLAAELSPDVVAMDVAMPDVNGIEATRQILADSPGTRVLAFSQHMERRLLADMLKPGAVGYLHKTSCGSELVGAPRTVIAGHASLSPAITGLVVDDYANDVPAARDTPLRSLTPRQPEVLQLVAEGLRTKGSQRSSGCRSGPSRQTGPKSWASSRSIASRASQNLG